MAGVKWLLMKCGFFCFFIHSYEPLHSENHFLREEGKKNDKDFPSAEGDH